MSEYKSIKLFKAAKELNIGINTILEFLGAKGFKIENKPTTKLDDNMYSVLLKEFQVDKIIKEEAKQISIGKIRRDEGTAAAEKHEPAARAKDFEPEEVLIKNLHNFTPASPVAPAAEKPKAEEPAKAAEVTEGALPGVKVVGKINLDDLNPKSQQEKQDAKPVAEQPAPQAKPQPVAATPAPVAPTPAEAAVKAAPEPVAKPVAPQPEPVKAPEPKPQPVAETPKPAAPAATPQAPAQPKAPQQQTPAAAKPVAPQPEAKPAAAAPVVKPTTPPPVVAPVK